MQAAAVSSTPDSERLRRTMADCQLRTFDVTSAAVIDAFESLPREKFVAPADAAVAYSDAVLTVSAGATERALLTPMVLARMLQGADVKAGDKALDLAGGLGYSAAILTRLGAEVTSLDVEPDFAKSATAALCQLGVSAARAVTGPLEKGWTANAPYDLILVNGAVEEGYQSLFDQLAPGGRLVAVVRQPGQTGRAAKAMRFDRLPSGVIARKWLFDAAAATLKPFARVPAFVF